MMTKNVDSIHGKLKILDKIQLSNHVRKLEDVFLIFDLFNLYASFIKFIIYLFILCSLIDSFVL